MREGIIGLGTIVLVLAGLFLKSALKTLIAMAIMWLTGTLYPFVAHALGIPEPTLYEFLVNLFEAIRHLFLVG